MLAAEFSNAFLFGRVHQLTVDAYAVQHAGGLHPDKSVDVHLCGLYWMLNQGVAPTAVPKMIQGLAGVIHDWPHFLPPSDRGTLTVFDVALANSVEDHIRIAREWANSVWNSWRLHHIAIADLASDRLKW